MSTRSSSPFLRTAALAVTAFTFVAPIANAQIQGELKGRVVDATGAEIAGAHVTLTQTATGIRQSSITTSDGIYDFTKLVSGEYSVAVDGTAFAPYVRNGITIATGQTVGLDLPLAVTGNDTITI